MIRVTNSICIKKEILHKKGRFGWGWDLAAPDQLYIQGNLAAAAFSKALIYQQVARYHRIGSL